MVGEILYKWWGLHNDLLFLSVPVAAAIIEFFDDFQKDKIEKFERMKTQE